MNILELTGMVSRKYGGIERYLLELQNQCPNDNFFIVYSESVYTAEYQRDIEWGG